MKSKRTSTARGARLSSACAGGPPADPEMETVEMFETVIDWICGEWRKARRLPATRREGKRRELRARNEQVMRELHAWMGRYK